MSLFWLKSSEVGREERGGGLVGGRTDEARTSHTQTLEMGRGPGDWTWTGLDHQTSEHLLEPRCWREGQYPSACERGLRVHAMCARVRVV